VLILLIVVASCRTFNIENGETKEIRGIPSFSADGVTMVYLDQTSTTLNLYDWQSKKAQQFTFPLPIYNPQISPDGERLFYTQLSEAGYFSELWTMDLATDEKSRLTDAEYGDIYSYAISPDGSCLAFFTFCDDYDRQSLFLMPLTASADMQAVGGEMPELSIDNLIQPVFSTDGGEVLFALNNEIYVTDVPSHHLEKVFSTDNQVYHLSASSDYGAFVARQDGYYQVFAVNLQSGAINQLTFDTTNKLLPGMDEDGYLYYLDVGERPNLMQLSYLFWMTSRNSTSVYKDYRNDWGRLAWGESGTLAFLITAYKAFNDGYFLEEFASHASSLLDNMDVNLGIEDYSGLSTYGWSTTRYSIDKRSRMRWAVHDSMLGVPFADYIKLVANKTDLDSELMEVAQDSLTALREIVRQHDAEWVEHETDELGITEEREGVLYVS
jgi:hypothetical protein